MESSGGRDARRGVRTAPVRSGTALLVWGLMLIAANLRASLTGVGPLLGTVRGDLGLSATAAGLVNTLPLLAFAAISPLVPRLVARTGAERALLIALTVLAGGIGVRWVPSTGALFLGTVLIGMGIAVGNVVLPSLIKRDFPTRIGLLTSAYATVMSGVAAVASGVVVPVSEVAPGGWRTAWGCWVVLAAVAALVWVPQARHRGVPRIPERAAPARPGLPWGSGLAWAVTGFMGLQSLGFYVVVTWLPSVFHDNGTSKAASGWLLFLFQAVAVATSLGLPLLLKRARDQRALAVASSLFLLAGYVGLLVAPHRAVLWSVVLGVGGGAALVLALAFLGLRARDAAGAGALSAMAQSMGYLLAAVGPVAFGALHTANGSWRAPLALVAAAAVVQTAVGWVAGRGLVAGADGAPAGRSDGPAGRGRRVAG